MINYGTQRPIVEEIIILEFQIIILKKKKKKKNRTLRDNLKCPKISNSFKT